jgi:hypothetical protein
MGKLFLDDYLMRSDFRIELQQEVVYFMNNNSITLLLYYSITPDSMTPDSMTLLASLEGKG